MLTADFDYELPPECIAQIPVEPRDSSRLLVLDRQRENLAQAYFHQLGEFLRPGDILVMNETRVFPARLAARKVPSGGQVELLLLRRHNETVWEALVGGKGMKQGRRLRLEQGPLGEIEEQLDGPRRTIRFDQPIDAYVQAAGQMPLPPYIHTPLEDSERYQTVYARWTGSAAAPTAGLHFTPELIHRLESQGVNFAWITLHVGLDTFAPVAEASPQQHKIHTEWCHFPDAAAQAINRSRQQGGRIIAVGTTSVRSLESAARGATGDTTVAAFEGYTDLFILPGHTFRAVDAMITNFHLPRSTLIMLVSAFAGRERILQAYQTAIQCGYRFYSFGDAMLIL